jgi:ornithine decarboxylase
LRLRDLCQEMHAYFRAANVSALQKAQFTAEHLPEPVMSPHEAARNLVRKNVDYLPIDQIEGRIAVWLTVGCPTTSLGGQHRSSGYPRSGYRVRADASSRGEA